LPYFIYLNIRFHDFGAIQKTLQNNFERSGTIFFIPFEKFSEANKMTQERRYMTCLKMVIFQLCSVFSICGPYLNWILFLPKHLHYYFLSERTFNGLWWWLTQTLWKWRKLQFWNGYLQYLFCCALLPTVKNIIAFSCKGMADLVVHLFLRDMTSHNLRFTKMGKFIFTGTKCSR